jgi:formylglycine-generating enzyme required for sulfatase activity
MTAPKVFLSHTSRMARLPEGRSFVQAALDALAEADLLPRDMRFFVADDRTPAEVCIDAVRCCDIYVGLYGLDYGSPVRDRPEVSYTELEFETALERKRTHGMRVFAFLLDEKAAEDGLEPLDPRQAAFRERVLGSGLTASRFDHPEELRHVLYRTLKEQLSTPLGVGPHADGTHGVVVETHKEVLDLKEKMQHLLDRMGMPGGLVRPRDSFSIRGEDERQAVKALLARFRQLPLEEQQRLPALLNGLGKLQVGSGDFAGAQHAFAEAARCSPEDSARAEAQHNAYWAALEQQKWDEALAAIQGAASLDPRRFAPFPLHRYEPRCILGAGGFGTAFLCRDANFDIDVVVKTLHTTDLARSLEEVFREARVLHQVSAPAIIGVRDCEYADPAAKARPYIIMEYFPGQSLEARVREHGPLSPAEVVDIAILVARGMTVAHHHGIFRRDLKPDNILVRKVGKVWFVKVIDFGLAMRQPVTEMESPRGPDEKSMLTSSVAGTALYAPPEQLGRLPGVAVGPFSDVYSFGKTFCYALFGTTEPNCSQWGAVPKELAELLKKCIESVPEHRHASFATVLPALAPAVALAPAGEVTTIGLGNGVEMKFAWCPPGTFLMGSPLSEEQREGYEGADETQHRVTLTTGYWLGTHPVTRGQFARFVQAAGYRTEAERGGGAYFFTGTEWKLDPAKNWRTPGFEQGDDHPVVCISWNDAVALCEWLNKQGGQVRKFRLPTEAEWEYACRAGTTTPFHFGETIATDQANYDGNYTYGRGKKGVFRKNTTPVGSFPANAWGLYDMHGNVWEWCQDWFGPYPKEDIKDPQGIDSGAVRVLRGGSWYGYPGVCRSAYRDGIEPGSRDEYYGCRVLLCLD